MTRVTLLSLLFCALAGIAGAQDNTVVLKSEPTIVINTTNLAGATLDLKQDTTFKIDPTSTATPLQIFKLVIISSAMRTLAWDTNDSSKFKFKESYGIKLPLKTPAAGQPPRLMLGFQYEPLTGVWDIFTTTEPVSFQCTTCPPK